jgi:hypothetical protein
MNITLRKASALQNSIQEAIKAVKIETTVEFNEFQNPETELPDANTRVFAADSKRSDLLMALYTIRGLVGVANANAGIDAKLTQAAYLDKRVAQLQEMAESKEATDLSIIKGKLDKIRNRKEESRASLYGRDDTVSTSVLSKGQIDSVKIMIRDLKKQKQTLNDEILELNVRTQIELNGVVEGVLSTEGLL